MAESDGRRVERRKGSADRRSAQERRTETRRSGFDRRGESAWEPIAIDGTGESAVDAAALVAAAIVTGCNVENATYGLTMCAERVALYKALSDGHGVFTRIAVVADTADPTPPCGSCRQLLWEYCGDIEVVLANLSGVKRRLRLSELLPLPFDARLLD